MTFSDLSGFEIESIRRLAMLAYDDAQLADEISMSHYAKRLEQRVVQGSGDDE